MRVGAPEGGPGRRRRIRGSVGGPDGRKEVPDPYGGPSPRLFELITPFSRARGVTGPFPSKEWVRGRWPGEKGSGPRGLGCLGRQRVVKDNYEALA